MATQPEMAMTSPQLSNGNNRVRDSAADNGTSNETDSVECLLNDLTFTHTKPLWTQMARYNPPLPNPKAVPFIWTYDEVRPYLIRAGKLVPEKQAERRVLMLVNPAFGMDSKLPPISSELFLWLLV